MRFDHPEDEQYFRELLCAVGEDLAEYADLFDFRPPMEKRREFQRLRSTHLSSLQDQCGETCFLRCAPDCDVRSGLTVDHVIPLSTNKLAKQLRRLSASRIATGRLRKAPTQSFGSNHPRNLALACNNCNSFKQNKILDQAAIRRILELTSSLGKTSRTGAGVEGVRRILAADNPYGVDLWDCATFAQSMLSTTSDASVAAQFVRLRASMGSEHRDHIPADASVTNCTLDYPAVHALSDGPLFKAKEMEDKWDVYFFHPHIYFARSWGGQLIYRATVRFENQSLVITRIESAGGHETEFSRRAVDYLVKSHILGAAAPHPLPGDLPVEATQIAAFSFSTFGRRCAYGTYADTTVLPWKIATG